MAIYSNTFDNGNLNVDYQYELDHNLGTTNIIPTLYDGDGVIVPTIGIFQVINSNSVVINLNNEITGTYKLLIYYDEATPIVTGRRAFELPEEENPAESLRFVIGKEGVPAVNVTFTKLKELIFNALGFLKITSALAEFNTAQKSQARANLDVMKTSDITSALAVKANLKGVGDALGTLNTTLYNPTHKYNPATLRNVNNVGTQLLHIGYVQASGTLSPYVLYNNPDEITGITSSKIGTGQYKITHNLGLDSYRVIIQAIHGNLDPDTNIGSVGFREIKYQSGYFVVSFADDDTLNDADFRFEIEKINTYQPYV